MFLVVADSLMYYRRNRVVKRAKRTRKEVKTKRKTRKIRIKRARKEKRKM